MSRARRLVALLVAALTVGALVSVPALAHEERPSVFPPIDATDGPPEYRPFDENTPHVVVCKPESPGIIAQMTDPELKALNEHLLEECEFAHLQAAVDHVRDFGVQGTNIYLLPGTYREEPSIDPACEADYEGHTGAYEYEDIIACGAIINLVTIWGDDPDDEDMACDNALCNLQIEGTGQKPDDVLFVGGFRENGDWIKHNGIKVDRVSGLYLKNIGAELFRENAIYFHETSSYRMDGIIARKNDLYGILTFAADHGIIENCETYYNGDSGIYPGSASDVNADSTETGELARYAVEIRNCKSHHNALGYSGTAGNSVWIHDNEFYDNGAGIVTDSFVGGHPGMPQDHLWIENNRIYANNQNYVKEFVHSGKCDGAPAERGYENGTVCPVFPVPVGTGIMIAGGNYNFVNDNLIYDNWRTGAMLFYVPSVLRSCAMGFNPENPFAVCDGSFEEALQPAQEDEVSNGNWFTNNRMGFHPSGVIQPNGTDFWWDDQGTGNCWQDNESSAGDEPTHNATVVLFDCDSGGSPSPAPNAIKSAGLVPCAQYDREDNNNPEGCDWFDDPAMPDGRQTAAGEQEPEQPAPDPDDDGGAAPSEPTLPTTGGGIAIALLGVGLLGGAVRLHRHRMQLLPAPTRA